MELARQLLSVAAVLALAAVAAWRLRRPAGLRLLEPNRRRRRLELVERLALSPHHTLCLVRLGGAELLLALSPGGCTLVAADPAGRQSGAAAQAAQGAGA